MRGPAAFLGAAGALAVSPPALSTLTPIFKIAFNHNVSMTTGTSFVGGIVTTANIAVGDTLIFTMARDNASTDSNPPTDTLTDDKGNTYTLRAGGITAGAGNRPMAMQFQCIAAQAVASGATITFTWTFQGGASIVSKCGVMHAYSGPCTFVNSAKNEVTGTLSPTVGLTPAAVGNLLVGQVGYEEPGSALLVVTADSDSQGGAQWSSVAWAQTATSGATNDNGIIAQSKIPPTTAVAQTYNPTLNATCDTIALICEYAPA